MNSGRLADRARLHGAQYPTLCPAKKGAPALSSANHGPAAPDRATRRRGLDLFGALAQSSDKGSSLLETWLLAARNLINRAEVTAFLLTHAATPRPLAPAARQQGANLLQQLRLLRDETNTLYDSILKPTRRKLVIDWLYRSVEHALTRTWQAH